MSDELPTSYIPKEVKIGKPEWDFMNEDIKVSLITHISDIHSNQQAIYLTTAEAVDLAEKIFEYLDIEGDRY